MSDTRQRLIEIAYERFGRNGFHAIGLDAIINEAGVSKQTFYNHFEGKDELILAVLNHRHETESKLIQRLFKEKAGFDPRSRLYALIDVIEAWFNQPEWRGCIFVTAASEFPVRTEPAHQAAESHFSAFREYLEELAANAGAAAPGRLADQLMIVVEGLVSAKHVTGHERFNIAAKEIARSLLDRELPQVGARRFSNQFESDENVRAAREVQQ
ncbi:MAG TPA: TetR/AcrR family transcriptional regulator [Tepidisphaeraceae bacterium]|nr:TetR/AcrR family transcriptional regulator [Tepidisphaeraceae bacterium]